jgi:hypothetical protein
MARSRFPAIRDHVLLPWASSLAQADRDLRGQLNPQVFEKVLDSVPDAWLSTSRGAYVDYFSHRLDAASEFVEEAVRARAQLV